ncbi:hypothetical protein [Paracoccus sp. (in: a-proteobacteria)]|uniref:hypothetical protein n=1 Tax=Paracoccus sp. TaxID=267 RepID=UPI00321FDB2D
MSARPNIRRGLGLAARAGAVLLCLAAPVLAVPAVKPGGATIEAPAMKRSGIGLVLLVSLRRG